MSILGDGLEVGCSNATRRLNTATEAVERNRFVALPFRSQASLQWGSGALARGRNDAMERLRLHGPEEEHRAIVRDDTDSALTASRAQT